MSFSVSQSQKSERLFLAYSPFTKNTLGKLSPYILNPQFQPLYCTNVSLYRVVKTISRYGPFKMSFSACNGPDAGRRTLMANFVDSLLPTSPTSGNTLNSISSLPHLQAVKWNFFQSYGQKWKGCTLGYNDFNNLVAVTR